MDFQDLVDSPEKVKRLAGTIAFLVAFPIYFAAVPSIIDEDLIGNGSSGLNGFLKISFEEEEMVFTESVVLGDGETHDTFFDVMSEDGVNIGYVELQVSCFDSDDPGPGFTDSVEGQSDLSDLEGIEDKNSEGDCSGGDSGFSIRWDLTDNYSGEEYVEEGANEEEIREIWSDGGLGRGSWMATITAEISSPPAPVIGQIVDSDEEFEITWILVSYTLVVEEG